MVAGFDDGKDERALRTIGEVGEALGIKAHVLRYWEGQFPQLQPMKRSGGRRYYRPEDVALITQIDRLVNQQGYTLRGAKAALAGMRLAAPPPDTPPSADTQPVTDTQPGAGAQGAPRAISRVEPAGTPTSGGAADAIVRLRAIRRTLAAALDA